MDAGHKVIDKFTPNGAYLNQIPVGGELFGFAIAADGSVRIDAGGILSSGARAHAFAVGVTGDDFILLECGCVEKFAVPPEGGLFQLGLVDSGRGDVAAAVDPLTGHLYLDDQSSVAEWDTGAMNGQVPLTGVSGISPSGALVSSFGSLQLSGVAAQQGGIAVNGASGEIYVSNPADGEVYVFGSAPPAVAAGAVANVSQTGARLQGTVDPRGVPVSSCVFEYEKAPVLFLQGQMNLTTPGSVFGHSVPCSTEHGEPIGEGASPVAVHADISGLEPGILYDYRLVAGNANGTSPSGDRFPTVGSGFGVTNFGISAVNQDGTPDTQAGSHPHTLVVNFKFKTKVQREEAVTDSAYVIRPDGNAKDILVTPPPGLVGNPNATEKKCSLREMEPHYFGATESINLCPPGSVVGGLEIEFAPGVSPYNPLKEPIYQHAAAAWCRGAVWREFHHPEIVHQLRLCRRVESIRWKRDPSTFRRSSRSSASG